MRVWEAPTLYTPTKRQGTEEDGRVIMGFKTTTKNETHEYREQRKTDPQFFFAQYQSSSTSVKQHLVRYCHCARF